MIIKIQKKYINTIKTFENKEALYNFVKNEILKKGIFENKKQVSFIKSNNYNSYTISNIVDLLSDYKRI